MSGSAISTIEVSTVAITTPRVVLNRATHLYRSLLGWAAVVMGSVFLHLAPEGHTLGRGEGGFGPPGIAWPGEPGVVQRACHRVALDAGGGGGDLLPARPLAGPPGALRQHPELGLCLRMALFRPLRHLHVV